MPRHVSQDDQTDFSNTSYGSFFQSSSDRLERYLADLEAVRLRKAAINKLEIYQQQIKNRQETQEKFKNLLKKDNLSPEVRSVIITKLKSLEANLMEDQAEFKDIVNSHPSFQAHFGLQT